MAFFKSKNIKIITGVSVAVLFFSNPSQASLESIVSYNFSSLPIVNVTNVEINNMLIFSIGKSYYQLGALQDTRKKTIYLGILGNWFELKRGISAKS